MAMSETERTPFATEHEASGVALSMATMPAALALVILGILALAKIDPVVLISIVVIIAGLILATEGAAVTRQIATALVAKAGHNLEGSEMPAGLNAGVLGGMTGSCSAFSRF